MSGWHDPARSSSSGLNYLSASWRTPAGFGVLKTRKRIYLYTGIVEKLIFSSFLDEKAQRNYFQSYQAIFKKLTKE